MTRLFILCAILFVCGACQKHPAGALVHLEHGVGHGTGHGAEAAGHGEAHQAAPSHAEHQKPAPAEAPKFFGH